MARKPTPFEVLLTQGAEHDRESIYDCIAESDGIAAANHVLDRLMQAVEILARRLFGA